MLTHRKSASSRFEALINSIDYGQLKIFYINPTLIKDWCYKNMPNVVSQLVPLGWDLSNDLTWTESVFVTSTLSWYGKRVALFLTTSYGDYKLANEVIACKTFENFRKRFRIDAHISVLINDSSFLHPDDLDAIYLALDFESGYSSLDYSHFVDEDLDYNDEFIESLQYNSEEIDELYMKLYEYLEIYN